MWPSRTLEVDVLHRIQLNRKRSAGMGLVEVMVALVIGMFGVLVMMQVLTVTEEQKRTTTSGNDAMNEGVMGLYAMQTDLRMAGYGIADRRLLGCTLTLRAGVVLNRLAPVMINSTNITGKDANTDSLLVLYGNTTGTPQGVNVVASGNIVQTPSAFSVNDWVVVGPASPPSPCVLSLQRVAGVDATNRTVTLTSGAALTSGDALFNLGQSIRAVGYAIRSGNLAMCDFTDTARDCTQASAWVPIANNMVSLRAQYARDTTAPNMDAIADTYDQTAPTTACELIRVPATRLALVARSTQAEKDVVTTAAPVWEGTLDAAGNPAAPIVLTWLSDWQKYRYKVFQTMVPLRNISWMGAVSGC
jgi:type IV pilus assembly protein PilW